MATNVKLGIIGALLLVCVALLFVGFPDFMTDRQIAIGCTLGHIVTFSILAYLLILLKPRFFSTDFYQQLAWAVLLAAFLGALVEFLQPWFGRNLEVKDFSLNMMGAAFAICFLSPSRYDLRRTMRYGLKLMVVVTLAVQLIPTISDSIDEVALAVQFPVLSQFKTEKELSRWKWKEVERLEAADLSLTSPVSPHVMGIPFEAGKLSIIRLNEFPKNWSKYQAVQIDLYNPNDDKLNFGISLYSENVQTIGHKAALKKGWNRQTVRFSMNPKFDLDLVKSLDLYLEDLAKPVWIYVNNVELIDPVAR